MTPQVEVERLSPSVVIQVRFNFTETQRDEQPVLDYQYLNVHAVTRSEIKRCLIKERYSLDDEIALINNRELGDLNSNEYNLYQSFRAQCSVVANSIVSYYESIL